MGGWVDGWMGGMGMVLYSSIYNIGSYVYRKVTFIKIILFAGKWVEPEIIILSEISQTHKYQVFSFMCRIKKKDTVGH
jgi:hypothetical protein